MMSATRSASTALFAAMLFACAQPGRRANTVVIASGADLESANPLVTLHPMARQVQRYALFVTLARYDDALEPAPYLAQSWAWSSDRRALRMHLAPGVRWHDGEPTTSRDVRFTLDAIRDRATGSPRFAELADVERVETPDDSTIVIRFLRPQSAFPLVLCEQPIAPAHLLESVPRPELRRAGFGERPLGNGPFRFVDRKPGQRWTFARNDEFARSLGGPPAIERLVIAVVDEASTKFAGLVSHELDMAGISPSMASLAAADPALRVLDYPVLVAYGIVFNPRRPPFTDALVRRAVALAIDRDRIIEAALAGFATPAAGPVAPDHPFSLKESPRRDLAAAAALLDSAGWLRQPDGVRVRDGVPFTFELLTVGSADNAAEQLIQADLGELGIRLEIRQREMGAFLAEARARDKRFDALLTGVPGDLSLGYLSSMFESELAGGALDYAGFHTARVDDLLRMARAATGDDARRQAWLDVQRELAREMPVAWLYHARGLQGVSRRLQGVRMDLRGELATLAQWRVAR
ncbi:MAG TPA: peptide ABC transporter substrate-binding protein [Gemmatimonadaceae bacterium]|nr:peptide ABC transporter substrate-binding protein [Gemmatimonadaceae bacterium]